MYERSLEKGTSLPAGRQGTRHKEQAKAQESRVEDPRMRIEHLRGLETVVLFQVETSLNPGGVCGLPQAINS